MNKIYAILYCCQQAMQKKSIEDQKDLKRAYEACLRSYQPHIPSRAIEQQLFVEDDQIEQTLINQFNIPDLLLDDRQKGQLINNRYSQEEKNLRKLKSTNAIEILAQRDPLIAEVLNLAINHIFFADSKTNGGTTSAAVGVIWSSNKLTWTEIDTAEFLVHELTHNLAFIDELCHKYFCNYILLSNKENFAFSAILNTARPLDKVIHSIFVAFEILSLRKRLFSDICTFKAHPPTHILEAQMLQAIDSVLSLSNKDELLTPHLLDLLSQCKSRTAEPCLV